MGDESDEALWALVAGGEPRSYGVIWDRHSDRVFRHVIRLGGEPQDADGTTAQKSLGLLSVWLTLPVSGSQAACAVVL